MFERMPTVVPAANASRRCGLRVYRGAALTTDAPFRETAVAIARFRAQGILAVKLEPAALYAFAQARRKPLLCLTRVTNQMAVSVGDFAKGEADGAYASLSVIGPVGDAWRGLEGWPA